MFHFVHATINRKIFINEFHRRVLYASKYDPSFKIQGDAFAFEYCQRERERGRGRGRTHARIITDYHLAIGN